MGSAVSVLALVVALGGPSTSTVAQTNPPLTAGDWPQPNFDYSNHRDATSSVISSNNISQLGVGWTFSVNGVSAFGANLLTIALGHSLDTPNYRLGASADLWPAQEVRWPLTRVEET